MEKRKSSKLRYNIKSRIDAMTRDDKATIKHKVLNESGISKSSYYNALALKQEDDNDISAKMLLAFSRALSVKMEELFNS